MAQSLNEILDRFDAILPHCARDIEHVHYRDLTGRILAQDVLATHDSPPFTHSAMDGYAFKLADFSGQAVITGSVAGTTFAGHPFEGDVTNKTIVRIMTGAPLPSGLDTVIPQELVTVLDNGNVSFDVSSMRPGDNVRQQGELFKKNAVLLAKGTRLTDGMVSLVLSLGFASLDVYRPLKVAVFSSGDELVEPNNGAVLAHGKIYNSNSYMVELMARRWGADVVSLGILPDNPEALLQALGNTDNHYDILVTTGGVGPGEHDFTSQVLEKLANMEAHQAKMKPGKAIVFGAYKQQPTLFIGLPGNPVAAFVSARLYLHRAIYKMQGLALPNSIWAHTTHTLKSRLGRLELMPGCVESTPDGRMHFEASSGKNSAAMLSMIHATHLGILPEEKATLEPGDLLELLTL